MIRLVFEVVDKNGQVEWAIENDAGEYPPVEGLAFVVRDADGNEGAVRFVLGNSGGMDVEIETPDGERGRSEFDPGESGTVPAGQ